MRGGTYVLNFYSAVFVDQLKRGRKTATIRLGDKSGKYERGQVVWVTVGFRHSPREKIFSAVIDDVEVKKISATSRARDIEHDNPEFRRLEDDVNFLEQIYSRPISRGRRRHRDPLLADRRAARSPLRQRRDAAATTTDERTLMAEYAFLTTWLLDSPREPVWEAIYDQERWPEWWRGVEEADELKPGDDGGRAARSRAWSGSSLLPYRVEFEVTTTAGREAAPDGGPRRRRAAGIGRWRLFEHEGVTAVLYEWNVATTKAVDEPDWRRGAARSSSGTTTG